MMIYSSMGGSAIFVLTGIRLDTRYPPLRHRQGYVGTRLRFWVWRRWYFSSLQEAEFQCIIDSSGLKLYRVKQ